MSRLRATSLGKVWGVPLVLALVTLSSLVGALVEEGVWDWIATLALAVVLAYACTRGLRPDTA